MYFFRNSSRQWVSTFKDLSNAFYRVFYGKIYFPRKESYYVANFLDHGVKSFNNVNPTSRQDMPNLAVKLINSLFENSSLVGFKSLATQIIQTANNVIANTFKYLRFHIYTKINSKLYRIYQNCGVLKDNYGSYIKNDNFQRRSIFFFFKIILRIIETLVTNKKILITRKRNKRWMNGKKR